MTSSSVPQMLPSLQTWGRTLFSRAAADNARSVIISARIASPLAVLSPEEQAEFLEGFGQKSYFTAGPKQARAWTIHIGDTAPQAAGVIHTDFEKGFIRAETIAFDDYVALRGEARAREAGKLRAEGKAYVVKDGDVMNFLFN